LYINVEFVCEATNKEHGTSKNIAWH